MFLPSANEVWGKVMFLRVSLILSTWGRGWLTSMHYRSLDQPQGLEGVGFPACITGHMIRGRGVCIHEERGLHPGKRGSVSRGGWVCIQGMRGFASRGRGSTSGIEGVCIQEGKGSASRGLGGLPSPHRNWESGRYASYWNVSNIILIHVTLIEFFTR